MTATYTVIEAETAGQRPDKGYGPMQVIKLSLKDSEGKVTLAEWYTKATTGVPNAGMSIEGDLENDPKFGMKFKKAKPQGGFGGGGGGTWKPRDPAETAAIQRQHSQEMALRYLAIQQSRGKIPEGFTLDGLKALVDWFELDIKSAPVVYGAMKRKDTEVGNWSDVPSSDAPSHGPENDRGTPWEGQAE